MADALATSISSLRSSLQLLDSSINILDAGVNDFPRLSKVLQTTRVSHAIFIITMIPYIKYNIDK